MKDSDDNRENRVVLTDNIELQYVIDAVAVYFPAIHLLDLKFGEKEIKGFLSLRSLKSLIHTLLDKFTLQVARVRTN